MPSPAVDRLNAAVDALDGALDRDDIFAINRALADVPPAIDGLRAPGIPALTAEDKVQLEAISNRLEASRVRVSVLTDLGRRRLDMLGEAGAAATYGR